VAKNATRLLLIEDDDIDREAIRRLLRHRYTIYEAPTAQVALTLLETMRPHCVLLDYRLPDIDGLQLIPKFTAAYIPVIVTTGEESPEVIVDAMRLGAQDYLVKNALSQVALEHAISNAIEKTTLQHNVVLQQQQLQGQASELRRRNTQVRRLASALTLAEQRERRRISQILHDHVQQMLFGIQMRAHMIDLDVSPEVHAVIHEHLQAIAQLTEDAIKATRTLTVELSPPVLQSKGLVAACRWLVEQMAKLHNIDVQLDIQTDYQFASEELSILIFQFVRELLFNVVKHANVTEAKLSIREEGDRLLVSIEDRGCGFEADDIIQRPRGFGIHSIHERLELFGGKLELTSQSNVGTCATINVPKELPFPESDT
jgi:signal transduction histidine kinase